MYMISMLSFKSLPSSPQHQNSLTSSTSLIASGGTTPSHLEHVPDRIGGHLERPDLVDILFLDLTNCLTSLWSVGVGGMECGCGRYGVWVWEVWTTHMDDLLARATT